MAARDPLTRVVIDRMLPGVSTRKYQVVGEEVEQEASSTAKSTVSELFIERTRTALGELMARRLDDVRLAVMMLDGLEIADRTHVVALGISTEGVRIPLGLWEQHRAREPRRGPVAAGGQCCVGPFPYRSRPPRGLDST
jgi:putative transposase